MIKSVQGMIFYKLHDYMSAQLVISGQPSFEIGAAQEAEPVESGRRYSGYSGPYYITEVNGKVRLRHGFRLCNRPDMVGDVLVLFSEATVDVNVSVSWLFLRSRVAFKCCRRIEEAGIMTEPLE